MPVSPTVRRRRLATELKALRTARNLTIEQAAGGIGMSAATLSRIENGQSGVKTPILRALLGVYGVTGQHAENLETLAKEANQRGWWQFLRAPEPFKTAVGLEMEATWINYFSNTLIIGLLQTEGYARAVVEAINHDESSEANDESVQARMRRQEILPNLHLSVIVGEESLLRPIGGRDVMVAQIERLITDSDKRNIDIQILPRTAGEHPGLSGNFEIIGLGPSHAEAVFVEGYRWDACIEDQTEIVAYTRSFDRLRAQALGFVESKDLLTRMLEELRDE